MHHYKPKQKLVVSVQLLLTVVAVGNCEAVFSEPGFYGLLHLWQIWIQDSREDYATTIHQRSCDLGIAQLSPLAVQSAKHFK